VSTALEQLGKFVANVGRDGISDDVRELVELHFIDSFGAWFSTGATHEAVCLQAYRQEVNGSETPATVGLDITTRCAMARLSEIDDIHLPSMITPGGIVVPAAVTMARAMRAPTADDIIAAILAGYEVMTRLGRAIDGPSVLYRGIWPTYFAAPMGVAAVISRLFGQDEKKAANSLALALTLASPGVGHHNAATTTRWLALGNAASNGVTAAVAGMLGLTSDLNLIDGNFLSGIYGVTPNIAALTEGLGDDTVLREVSFKPWCAARQTMPATQALREIIDGGVAPESITEVHAFVLPPHLKMIDHGVMPGDRASHLTSLPYCMAVAAVDPQLAFDVQMSPPELSATVRDFMRKIKVEPDASLLADYPRRWRARVRITSGGGTYEQEVMDVPGDPAEPFNRYMVEQKFLRFVTPSLGAENAQETLRRCSAAMATGDFSPLV
jgi:2-methylcitrate dehydratase PrpD